METPLDTLHGGPYDGLWLTDDHFGAAYLYVEFRNRFVAAYVANAAGLLVFNGYRRTGEGCMPDIFLKDLEASQ